MNGCSHRIPECCGQCLLHNWDSRHIVCFCCKQRELLSKSCLAKSTDSKHFGPKWMYNAKAIHGLQLEFCQDSWRNPLTRHMNDTLIMSKGGFLEQKCSSFVQCFCHIQFRGIQLVEPHHEKTVLKYNCHFQSPQFDSRELLKLFILGMCSSCCGRKEPFIILYITQVIYPAINLFINSRKLIP